MEKNDIRGLRSDLLKVGLGRTGRWKKGFANWWSSASWTCIGVLLKCRIRVSRSGVVLDILQVDQVPSWCMESTGPALIAGKSAFLPQSGCWASSRRRVEADLLPTHSSMHHPQDPTAGHVLATVVSSKPHPNVHTHLLLNALASPASSVLPSRAFPVKVILGERNRTPPFPGPCHLAVRIPEDWKVKSSPLLQSGDVMSRLSLFHGSRSPLVLEPGVSTAWPPP